MQLRLFIGKKGILYQINIPIYVGGMRANQGFCIHALFKSNLHSICLSDQPL